MKMLQGLPFRRFRKYLSLKKPVPFGRKVVSPLVWPGFLGVRLRPGAVLLASPSPPSMPKVELGQEVLQQLCLGVGPESFAQVLVELSWEGTMLCSGKARSGGVKVFCPGDGELKGLMETRGDAWSPVSRAPRREGAWPQEVERLSRDACDLLWEESGWGRTKEASFYLSQVSASKSRYPYPRWTEKGGDGTEAKRRWESCLSNRPELPCLESATSQDCQGRQHQKMKDVHSPWTLWGSVNTLCVWAPGKPIQETDAGLAVQLQCGWDKLAKRVRMCRIQK